MENQTFSAQTKYISHETQPPQPLIPEPLIPGQEPVRRSQRPTQEQSNQTHNLNLAHQVLHNLRYQHDWTDLKVHTYQPVLFPHSPLPTPISEEPRVLSRPLISGVPPKPVYIHPDTQLALIRQNVREEDCLPEHMVVVPTRLVERVTLRQLAEVFDALPEAPEITLPLNKTLSAAGASAVEETGDEADPTSPLSARPLPETKWKTLKNGHVKRVLLATVDDDSSITYYVVHDGIVKPRQN